MIKDISDWNAAINEAQKITYKSETNDHENTETRIVLTEPKSFQESARIIGKALELLLVSKNQKCGKGNILGSSEFGIDPRKGVTLRANDKFERLKNGLCGADLGKEGFVDSWGDMIGYNAIGLLLELGWYGLPITLLQSSPSIDDKNKGGNPRR